MPLPSAAIGLHNSRIMFLLQVSVTQDPAVACSPGKKIPLQPGSGTFLLRYLQPVLCTAQQTIVNRPL
jgi:hypothetical protein